MQDNVYMSPPVLSKGRLWAALAVILFGQFVVSIDLTVLNIALPDLTRELNPSSDQLLWIIDVYSLVVAGLLVATSSLSDRFGRKRMLLAGFFIFGAASGLVMIADSAEFVIGIRATLGVAGAMIMPVTIAMIRSIFDDAKERALAIAVWSSVSAIGMATGPLIGGVLLDLFSWHAAFFVNVPMMGTALLIGVFVLPEVKLKDPGKFDALASVLFLAGMVSFLWGIKHLAAELELDMPGIVTTVLGLVLLALFIARCATSKSPLVDISLFKGRAFSGGVVAMLFSTFAMAILLYLLSQWFQLVNGDSSMEAGMKLIPMAAASLVSCLIATNLAIKFRVRSIITSGMIIAAAALISLTFFRDDLTLAPIMVSTILVGFGTGALALGGSLMLSETPAEKASSSGSIQEISYDLGNVLGVAILGSVASIVYRQNLHTRDLRDLGFDGQTIDIVKQSFSAACEVGKELGIPELNKLATQAFDESVVVTCLIGGILIFVVALVVWALIPKDTRITEDVGMDSGEKEADAPAPAPAPFLDKSPSRNEGAACTTISLEPSLLAEFKRVCEELGVTPAIAFSIFATKVAKEERIPFELAVTDANRTSCGDDSLQSASHSQ